MKIFYFTGTGNSLAVAKRLSGELASIPQVMKERDFVFKDEAIGIIFPLYSIVSIRLKWFENFCARRNLIQTIFLLLQLTEI